MAQTGHIVNIENIYRGRALSWEMFPFSFREFLDYKGIESDGPLSTKKCLTIQKAFEEYWETGGFPEVASFDRMLRIKTHQEYFNAMLFRDLVERHDIRRTITVLIPFRIQALPALAASSAPQRTVG